MGWLLGGASPVGCPTLGAAAPADTKESSRQRENRSLIQKEQCHWISYYLP